MEITVKSNNSSGICDENERDNLLPGLIQIPKHIFRWENSQSIPQGGQQWRRGEAKQHCSLDFEQLEKGEYQLNPAAQSTGGGKELFTGNNHNYKKLPAVSPVTAGASPCITQASCP